MKLFGKQFFRFLIVGVINTLTGSAIMFILYNAAHLSYWFSSACNYVITSIVSFFLNKYFTFAVKEWSLLMVAAFAANIVCCYCFAYGIAKPVMQYALQSQSIKIQENGALFAGMCLFTGLNYAGQRFIVFNSQKGEEK
ncbi:MAG: GtrA family protein [Spirochaetaceae bacterium]|jgi:putative flippase GtrA|nr:GtrA family protein [Spirochaetaceae bacterium]